MIQRWQNLKVTGKFIFGSKQDTLFRYDINTFMYDEWKIPEQITGARSFNFSASRLYALRKECDGKLDCHPLILSSANSIIL